MMNFKRQDSRRAKLAPPIILNKDEQQAWVRKAWGIISDPDRPGDPESVQFRISLIRRLEEVLGKEFRSTKEARESVAHYLDGFDGRRLPVAQAIKRKRKKLRLTQRQLAISLGFKDHTLISKYEKGERTPSEAVLNWLREGEV